MSCGRRRSPSIGLSPRMRARPVAAVNRLPANTSVLPGIRPGMDTVPAKPGDIIDIYATGFGPTNPPVAPWRDTRSAHADRRPAHRPAGRRPAGGQSGAVQWRDAMGRCGSAAHSDPRDVSGPRRAACRDVSEPGRLLLVGGPILDDARDCRLPCDSSRVDAV